MTTSSKNNLFIALSFAFYQVLTNLFFASYEYIDLNLNLFLYFFIVFCVFFSFEFSYLDFLLKTKKRKGLNKLIFSGSFLGIGILGSSLIWFFTATKLNHYLVFVSSFFIASLLPTFLSLFYFLYKETEEKLSKLGNVSLKNDENSEAEEDKLFHLENANGKLLLEVAIKNIICFEANDNYVVTYYMKNENDSAKSMERISLKKIEEMLINEQVVFNRVHKSYLINPYFLDEVKGRAQAYKIKLNHFSNLIPVSRTYDINLLKK